MKIIVLTPQSEFSAQDQQSLAQLGKVVYTDSRRPYSLPKLINLCRGADILALDPDNLGGFESTPTILPQLLDQTPSIRKIALATTSHDYIDQTYCRGRGIQVTNIPHYASESVAEHTLALLLGCSKRIFSSDRATQNNKYQLQMGHEIAGKTLGIIGLGSIGQRTAQLAAALGLKVIAWNRTPRRIKGVKLTSFDKVLSQSDYLSLHLINNPETTGILSKKKIARLKEGVIIVNTAHRELVDEHALSKALKSGQVDSYALEAEDLDSPPLGQLKNVFLFKFFGWYTKEALDRNKKIWVKNIVGLATNRQVNRVY